MLKKKNCQTIMLFMQDCMNNCKSLHIADNFYKDSFIKVFMNGIRYNIMQSHTMTVLLEYINRSLQLTINA